MKVRLLAFTDKGFSLARRLARGLGGEASRCGAPHSLQAWTAQAFCSAQALVFVGAAGIAVRAVAPHLKSKTTDPAVVVVDECGRFVIPLLSGHLGGANDLARQIARLCGAVPVLTTATDVNGVFAVDEWAKRQGCVIQNPEKIKQVSAKLLAGDTALLRSAWAVAGRPPQGVEQTENEACDIVLSFKNERQDALRLVPRIAVIGVGCKKGTGRRIFEEGFAAMLAKGGVCEEAVYKVCSIDLKQDEPGLLAFCRAHGFAFETFSTARLQKAEGDFSASAFVQSVTGVDNVCERSAVLGSGGALYLKKNAGNGVTMALALAPFAPDWRWTE